MRGSPAEMIVPNAALPKASPGKPKLKAGPDALTEYAALTATVPGAAVREAAHAEA